MTRSIIAAVAAAAVVLSGGIAFAQKGQAPKGPKTTQSAPKTHVTKTSGAAPMKSAAAQGPKTKTTTRTVAAAGGSKTKAPKTTTVAKTTKTTTKPSNTAKSTTKPSKATTTTSAKPEKSKTTTTTDPTTTLSAVQQKLQRNTNLAEKLESRLPKGTDLMKAAEDFRNLGQFVAAVNASYNHEGVSFTELKKLMVDEGMSLGQAVKQLRNESDADATTIARRATTEADMMIAEAEKETARKNKAKAPKAKMGSGS